MSEVSRGDDPQRGVADCKPIDPLGPGGTRRTDLYRPLYEAGSSPFASKPEIYAFLHEPHDQLLRQALLAERIVSAGEFGIDRALLVHAIPAANTDLANLVANLSDFGSTISEIWTRLLPGSLVRYVPLDTSPLLTATAELDERYGGLL